MRFIGNPDEGTAAQKLIWAMIGLGVVLAVWVFLTSGEEPMVARGILPSPWRVLSSYGELFNQNELIRNAGFSIGLNLAGYVEAIVICLPLGFVVGLLTRIRWGFQEQIGALRYVPLTALIGLFIIWFGIGANMKIHFLAFGILIYLLPIMVQRIDEVDDVYLKTVHTLGATDWQVLRTVYLPSVLSRLSDDIRVLTAISWTYIIVAEGTGSQGGLGDLIWKAGLRQGRVDKVFALLIVIMIIGVVQDRLFVRLDKDLFPHKYQARESVKASRLRELGFLRVAADFGVTVFGWMLAGIYLLMFVQEYLSVFGPYQPLTYLFGPTTWVMNFLFFVMMAFRAWRWYVDRRERLLIASLPSKTAGVA